MDHESVLKTQVVERYFLGELSQAERDAFEDHYFSCEICAADVRETSLFVDNARALCREERLAALAASQAGSSRRRAGRWLAWLTPQTAIPALAAVALVCVVSYQNAVTIPTLQAPRSIAPAIIFDGATRAAVKRIHEGESLRFQFLCEVPEGKARVMADLVDASGRAVRSGVVDVPAKNEPFDVYFPGMLHSGRYRLVLRAADGPGPDLVQFPFEVVPREMKINE